MVNFYHRFTPHAAALMKSLHEVAHSKQFSWSADRQRAFQATKIGLAAAVLLIHPSHTASTSIRVVTSDTAVGGVMEPFRMENESQLLFLQEAQLWSGQIQCIRPGVVGNVPGCATFPALCQGASIHNVYEPQSAYLRLLQTIQQVHALSTTPL